LLPQEDRQRGWKTSSRGTEISSCGEIDGAIKDNLAYLSALRKAVAQGARRRYPMDL
jgi:hypothetical protein